MAKETCSKLHEQTEHIVKYFIGNSQNLEDLTKKLTDFNEKMPEDKIEFFIFKSGEGDSLIFCTGPSDRYRCIGLQVCESTDGELIVKNLNAF